MSVACAACGRVGYGLVGEDARSIDASVDARDERGTNDLDADEDGDLDAGFDRGAPDSLDGSDDGTGEGGDDGALDTSSDVPASDASSDSTTDADASGLPLLSFTDFETGTACDGWRSESGTATRVMTAHNGSYGCLVCARNVPDFFRDPDPRALDGDSFALHAWVLQMPGSTATPYVRTWHNFTCSASFGAGTFGDYGPISSTWQEVSGVLMPFMCAPVTFRIGFTAEDLGGDTCFVIDDIELRGPMR